MSTPLTWKELEAQGVRRCCAMFTTGKQCARRAEKRHGFSWCAKHGPILEAATRANLRVVRAQKAADESDTK